jgi:Uncharacterised nucleotidyltransferase
VNRALARAVIASLRISEDSACEQHLQPFGIRDWQRTLNWLDDSGLSLYFLRHLQVTNTTAMVSPKVLAYLEVSLRNNHVRWERLAQEFARISQGFEHAGIGFAVIKGLALVPDYCPDALLRAPSDLDFLINREDMGLANSALEKAGYRVKTTSDMEVQFWKPSPKMPTTSDSPYSASTEPLVELHFGFWDDENRIPLREPIFSVDRVVSHSWQGLIFPVLNERDAFLLQVIHVFHHVTHYWLKLSWLLELGFFLSNRALDTEFWLQVDHQMEGFPGLREFAAIVVYLVKVAFGATAPEITNHWMDSLGCNSRLWLEKYAEDWLIDDHPFRRSAFLRTAKLSLFLHQQYVRGPKARNEVLRERLFPWKRPDSRSFPSDYAPSHTLKSQWIRSVFVLNRLMFHAGATLRYLCEVPRWRYRVNRYPGSSNHPTPAKPSTVQNQKIGIG